MLVTKTAIVEGLEQLGVKRRDWVFAHSSLKAFGEVDGGAHAVIDALWESVGESGLLAMPTHTWGTVNRQQPVFHVQLTPSMVGHITEVFRHRAGAGRSWHPTHSVAALGPDSGDFLRGHEQWSTPCAKNSPYGRLVDAGGWVLLLGVDLSSLTLFHAFEEWAEVPWLFNREETLYTVLDGGTVLTVLSRRHTNDSRYARDYPALEPWLRRRGLLRSVQIGAATVRILDAKGTWDALKPVLRVHPDLFLAARSPAAKTVLDL
ncbi:MAG: AAC(3) family N-acetyltransferase [Firmicutes bacterium]|nr:AAC(3) family N-acetyltransferase [Bacillota bacterium]